MITAESVQRTVERHLEGTPHFLVAVDVRPGNKVVVEVDNDQAITIEELAQLNRAVRDDLGPEADDLEIQFSSPGIGRPFKVMRQYHKHMGRLVDLDLVDGRTLRGLLDGVDEQAVTLRIQHPSKVKGRLPKLDEEPTVVPFAEIKATKATITFN